MKMTGHVKYFYIRQPDQNTEQFGDRGRPIACVAYVIQGREDGMTAYKYALSTVSSKPDEETGRKDQFDKQKARDIALTRLAFDIPSDVLYTDSTRTVEVQADIMQALIEDKYTPSRVKRECRDYLEEKKAVDDFFAGFENSGPISDVCEIKPEVPKHSWLQTIINWFKNNLS
jgi:hypothetical protein